MTKGLTRILPVLLLLIASDAQAGHGWREGWSWHTHRHESEHHDEYGGPSERRHEHGQEKGMASGVDELDSLGVGPYLGLHMVLAQEAYRNGARRRVGGNRNVDESFGFGARLGYRFHPHLAAELHSEWIEGFDLQQFPGDHSEIRTWTTTANGKLYFGHARLQPYVLAGLGLQRAWVRNPTPGGVNFDDVVFVGRFGGGIDYQIDSHLSLNLESSYLMPTGDLDDYDTVSIGLGLLFRF